MREWIPHPMQYCILIQSLGMMQVSKALFSSRSFLEEASTMSLMVKRFIALSLGQSLPQLTQTMVLTQPLLFLLRPWFLLFTGMVVNQYKIYLLIQYLILTQQLTMLKAQQKYRYSRETTTLNKKLTVDNSDKNRNQLETTRGKKSARQYLQKTPFYHSNHRQSYPQKENRGVNEESPRISYNFEKDREYQIDDVDSLSQIRFISKECSSIKQNNVDIDSNSQALSRNQLEDFSPLFDRIQKNTNDDFILQIEDITQSEPSIQRKMFRKCESVRQMRQKREDIEEHRAYQPKRCLKSGKIKKNRANEAASHAEKGTIDIAKQIQEVFISLDCRKQGRLTKHNCNSENLSTQMNYLIGSILTKIKAKGKEYRLQDFKHQFNTLISDSQQSELNQIFMSNRLKMRKLAQNQQLQSEQQESEKQQQSQTVLNDQFSNRLSKIDEKLIKYLKKNNIPQKIAHNTYESMKISSVSILQKPLRYEFPTNTNYGLFSQNITKQTEKSLGQRFTLQNQSDQYKTQVSLRSYSQTIRGIQGSQFQLSFVQLNKHI